MIEKVEEVAAKVVDAAKDVKESAAHVVDSAVNGNNKREREETDTTHDDKPAAKEARVDDK